MDELAQRRADRKVAVGQEAHRRGLAFSFKMLPAEHFAEELGLARNDEGPICIMRMTGPTTGDAMTPGEVRKYAQELLDLAASAECEACNPAFGSDTGGECMEHRPASVSSDAARDE